MAIILSFPSWIFLILFFHNFGQSIDTPPCPRGSFDPSSGSFESWHLVRLSKLGKILHKKSVSKSQRKCSWIHNILLFVASDWRNDVFDFTPSILPVTISTVSFPCWACPCSVEHRLVVLCLGPFVEKGGLEFDFHKKSVFLLFLHLVVN